MVPAVSDDLWLYCNFRNDHLCNALGLGDVCEEVYVVLLRKKKETKKIQRGKGHFFIRWDRLHALTFHRP